MNERTSALKLAMPAFFVNLLKAMRLRQWLKNGFLFAPLLFSGNLLQPVKLQAAVQGFFLFSLISSSVYLINDIIDAERDRQHPRKRLRPIAAGLIAPGQAAVAASILAMGAFWWALGFGLQEGAIAMGYFTQSLLYSLWWKHLVLVDVFVIALGFVLRVLMGGAVIDVVISPWLLVTTILLALLLALAKRRSEIVSLTDPETHRGILAEYPLALVDQLIGIAAAGTVVVYALYSFLVRADGRLIYTFPVVLFGLFRYLYLVYRHQAGGEPEELMASDKPLAAAVLLWGVLTLVLLYG